MNISSKMVFAIEYINISFISGTLSFNAFIVISILELYEDRAYSLLSQCTLSQHCLDYLLLVKNS